MTKTISGRWPKSAPRGDTQAMCDYCGVQWRRSQLCLKRSKLLACPDCAPGRDEVTLDELNAMGASRERGVQPRNPPGRYDPSTSGQEDHLHRTTAEDIYS